MTDKRLLSAIYDLLPLTDCEKCGLKTCREFAENLILGENNPHDCPPISQENAESLFLILEDYFK